MNFVKMWQAYPHSTTTGNDKSLMGIEDDENAIQEKCGTRKHGTRMQGWKERLENARLENARKILSLSILMRILYQHNINNDIHNESKTLSIFCI